MEQPTQTSKKSVLSTTVQPDIFTRVAELANEREWSVAQAGGYLIRLGLEKLEEMTAQPKAKSVRSA